jgi:hypothetical protein
MGVKRRLRIIRDHGPVMQIVLVARYTGLCPSKDLVRHPQCVMMPTEALYERHAQETDLEVPLGR